MNTPPRAGMVGRIVDPATVPGGAALVAKAARAGSLRWFVWFSRGATVKPVKIVAASESPDGKAVFEDRSFATIFVKGRHVDGRRFAVRYVETKPGTWSADTAIVLTHEHSCTLPPERLSLSDPTKVTEGGEVYRWTTERPYFDTVPVSQVKQYTKEPMPDARADD